MFFKRSNADLPLSQQNIAEYKILLDTLVFRVNALSVSAVQVVAEGKLSLITLPSSSSSLVGCILDVGRCNSFIPLSNFGFSYFQDYYHREAHFLGKNCFSLIKESCIGSSQETLIPIAAHLLPLVSRFVGLNALRQQSFSNSHEAHPKIWFVIAATQSADKVLHMLGRLGALPNRDWQLANFSLGFNQVNEIADAYIKKLTHEHYQLRSLFDEQNALPYFSSSCEDKIKELIDSIRLLKKGYSPSFQAEQRFFYLNFIEKLLLAFKHLHTGVQARLALARMDKLLQQTTSNNYTIFLRTIEALINEFLILKLLEQEKHPKTAQMLMEEIKAFIIQTVDAAPQMATFRTSAMQAISSSLQLAFTIFDSKRKKAPFLIYLDACSYYEINLITSQLFSLADSSLEECLSIEINSNESSKSIKFEPDIIYDLYIANFESNALMSKSQNQFVDINDFVANQLKLRQITGCINDRPLIVLIDNTMSDFDEIFLPFLLLQFNEALEKGFLCVLVCHSGNKYLHLGTDQALAALWYGFYNPSFFPIIEELIHQERADNQCGDLTPNSPTVLLTMAFMQQGIKEVLSYSSLIRNRTRNLFHKSVPAELLNDSGYFMVDTPLSKSTYKGFADSDHLLQNSSGFIVVKCNGVTVPVGDCEKKIQDLLNDILLAIGIPIRDGFGFSQTTYVWINASDYPDVLRISIGTESLTYIERSIGFICDFLLQINESMERYTLRCKKYNTSGVPKAIDRILLSDDIQATYKMILAKIEKPKASQVGLSPHSFFCDTSFEVPEKTHKKTNTFSV